MKQLSEDHLGTLGDHLVAGPHTPSHIVMTRGRSIRRRRQLGGGAALAAAASVTAVLGPNVFSRHRTGPQTTNPAVSAPTAITEPEAPCAPSKHIAQSLTPQQIPDVIYLLKSPPSKAVSAGISGPALMCNDRVISGADISATGVVEHSFRLTYSGIPIDPTFFPANPNWPRETVRGTEGEVNSDTARWVENGRLWSWQSFGVSKQAMLAAIESLQPDPADPKGLVAPSGLMDVMTSQTVSVAGDRWSVQYGTGHSRWDFAVEDHWAATGPPLQYTDPRNSRLLQVGDLQVLITKDDVIRDGNGGSAEANVDIARWNDGHGHVFSLAGDFTDQQLRDAVRHMIKVAPDDPRVTALVN